MINPEQPEAPVFETGISAEHSNVQDLYQESLRYNMGVPVNPYTWLVKKIGKKLAGPVMLGSMGLGGGAVAAYGQHLQYGITAEADLDKAHTRSDNKVIAFDKTQKIDVATAYFEQKFTATKIKFQVDTPFVDVIPDYYANKELDGVGAEKFEVPIDAETIQQTYNEQSHKVDLTVNLGRIVTVTYWPGAGPTIRDFTVNKGGTARNYGDRAGFRDSFIHGVGGLQKIVNLDTLSNTLEDANNRADHDIKLKGLESFQQACAPKLEPQVKQAVTEAITQTVKTLGDGELLGEINYTSDHLAPKPEVLPITPVNGKTYAHPTKMSIKEFKVDEINCDLSPVEAQKKVGE